MAKFLVFFSISLVFHLILLFGLSRLDSLESLNPSSFSKRSGKSSIKARLVVQEKIKRIPDLAAKKTPKSKPVPKQRNKAVGQSRVEDRSNRDAESGSDERLARYLSDIRELILKNKFKGSLASRLNLVGTSTISFKIEAPNKLKELKLVKSSGKRPLDESAVETVRRVGAMPAIPAELGLREITISLEMEFE